MKKKEKTIKGGVAGCVNCGCTESRLPMNTRLYNGFGGWMITKDDDVFFMEKVNTDFNKSKTLRYIEKQARLAPGCDWRAVLNLPLRSAVYQRQGNNKWMLIKKGMGFA